MSVTPTADRPVAPQVLGDDTVTITPRTNEDTSLDEPEIAANIGRHVVIERIGRGGMGSVYRAYDPSLQREVALKRLRPKAMGLEGRIRFEQEARAMAALSHPNVVAVYDVEVVDDDDVVLVMEFVNGPSLRTWLRQGKRSWSEVLAPFLDAARGLAGAHSVGLLHRDFKPDNVVVAEDQAKVTDFGIAKRITLDGRVESGLDTQSRGDSRDTLDSANLTRAGTVMGTPRYMAPEQHAGDVELGPAVDQFAFCVALWEALTQTHAYEGVGLRRKKEAGPPPWPSDRGPRWLGEVLRRGMAPNPDARWPSMDALIAELSRDRAQRRVKLVRAVTGVGMVGLAATVAFVAGADERDPCKDAERQLGHAWNDETRAAAVREIGSVDVVYAQPLAKRIAGRLDAFAETWSGERYDACEAGARGDYSVELRDRRAGCLDRGRVAFSAVVGVLRNANVDVLLKADTLVEELPDPLRCSDLAALQEGTMPPGPAEAAAVAELRESLEQARVERFAGRFEQATSILATVESGLESLGYLPVRGEFEFERAKLREQQGQREQAEAAYAEALNLAIATTDKELTARAAADLIRIASSGGRYSEVVALRPIAESASAGQPRLESRVTLSLGLALSNDAQFEAAEALLRRAVALLGDATNGDAQRLASARGNLANNLRTQGRFDDADIEYRAALRSLVAALGSDHPTVAAARMNLAENLREMGRLDEALTEALTADEVRRRTLGPMHVRYGRNKSGLAAILADARRFEDAEAAAREGVEIVLAAVGRSDVNAAHAFNALGRIQFARDRLAEAEASYRETLDILVGLYGPDHPAVAPLKINIASILHHRGRYEESEAAFRTALDEAVEVYGSGHQYVATIHQNLGALYLSMERYDAALDESEVAFSVWRGLEQGDSPPGVQTRGNRATALLHLGRPDEAEAEHRAIVEIVERKSSANDPVLAIKREALARVLLHRGRAVEARDLAELAWTASRKDGLTPEEQGNLLMTLARSIVASTDTGAGAAEARVFANQALGVYESAGDSDAEQGVRDWLRAHPG
ncbi:MAG: serine/threonine-protein kinase [Myxococcota bacterium]